MQSVKVSLRFRQQAKVDFGRPMYEPMYSCVARDENKAIGCVQLAALESVDLIPLTAAKANAARKCVQSHQCAKHGRRKETRYFCQTCMSQPALCVLCNSLFPTVSHSCLLQY